MNGMADHSCGLPRHAAYRAPAAVRRRVDWGVWEKGASASVALLTAGSDPGTDAGG